MAYNQKQTFNIKTEDETNLEEVHDFKYLGAWMSSTEQDIKVRKAAALGACNKLSKI